MNFSQGHSGTKVQRESCLFSEGKTPEITEKWAKFMNFSFWPFLWFGLPGRLLKVAKKCQAKFRHFSTPRGPNDQKNLIPIENFDLDRNF